MAALEEALSKEPLPPDKLPAHIRKVTAVPPEAPVAAHDFDPLPFQEDNHWTYPVGVEEKLEFPGEDWSRRAYLLVSMSEELISKFLAGYQEDVFFKLRYMDVIPNVTLS